MQQVFLNTVTIYDRDGYFLHTRWLGSGEPTEARFATVEDNARKFIRSPYWPKWREDHHRRMGPFRPRTTNRLKSYV